LKILSNKTQTKPTKQNKSNETQTNPYTKKKERGNPHKALYAFKFSKKREI